MNKILLTVLLFISALPAGLDAQCYACEAYADALVLPSEVRMLQLRDTDERPDERIGECKKLQVLFWENAGISSLPPSFGKLQSLTDLSLAGNKLTDLPDCIYLLKGLKVLNLQNNLFDEATKSRVRSELSLRLPDTKVFL